MGSCGGVDCVEAIVAAGPGGKLDVVMAKEDGGDAAGTSATGATGSVVG